MEQLKAARSFLSQLEKGADAYKEVVGAQCTMAMSVMAPWTFISAEDSAALVLQIGQMPFGKKKIATLLGRVTELATSSAHMLAANAAACTQLMAQSRTPMQDFVPITAYLSAKQWAAILDERSDFMARVAIVLQACRALGWRTLHEPTIQVATGIALAVDGFERALGHCPMVLWGYFKRAKTYAKKLTPWKVCKQLAESEPSFVNCLPVDPKDMKRTHPEVYSRVYGGRDGPTACPLDSTQLLVLCEAIPMRDSKARLKSYTSASAVDLALQLADRAMTMHAPDSRGHDDRPDARDGMPYRRYTPSQPAQDAPIPLPDKDAEPKAPSKHTVEEARDAIYKKLKGGLAAKHRRSTSPQPPSDDGSTHDVDDGAESVAGSDSRARAAVPKSGRRRKTDAVGRPKAKAKAKGAKAKAGDGDRRAKRKAKRVGQTVGKGNAKKSPKPSYSVEWSRNQVLCRTGASGPGQSTAFKFSDYGGSSDRAISAAKWVAKQKGKLGHGV